jgi:hypothetical protein
MFGHRKEFFKRHVDLSERMFLGCKYKRKFGRQYQVLHRLSTFFGYTEGSIIATSIYKFDFNDYKGTGKITAPAS